MRELPDARAVSLIIKSHSRVDPEEREERASPINSLFMMQVGQFLDHDVTHTPAQSGKRLFLVCLFFIFSQVSAMTIRNVRLLCHTSSNRLVGLIRAGVAV